MLLKDIWPRNACNGGHYIATGSASLSYLPFLGQQGGPSNALELGPRKQLVWSPVALGPGQPGAANSCLVQPRPKPRALFLKQK